MSLRLRLAGVVVCAIAGAVSAEAGVRAGYYLLTVGSTPPCKLSLAGDGTASLTESCNKLGAVARWNATAAGFDLVDGNGTALASLKDGNDAYTGRTAGGQRVMVAR